MNHFFHTNAVRNFSFSRMLSIVCLIFFSQNIFAQTPVPMASQPGLKYTETFADIANWTNNFASGNGANRWGSVAVNATGTIPDGKKTTVSTATFVSGSSGGVQRGTENIVLLSTGTTDNSSADAIDIFLDYTGVSAGTVTFNWAGVANGTGDRSSSLKVYTSTDGVTFTELADAAVLNVANNTSASGEITNVTLPASFSGSATARIRFYEFNGTGGTTGSRAKISIDSLVVTAVTSKQDQTITFNALPTKHIGDADFSPNATASSGLTVKYASSNTSVATIVSNKIHIVATGNTLITATQAGNSQYNAAPPVSQNLLVTDASKTDQTITFNAIAPKKYGGANFNLTATASSGLTVTYTSSNTDVATISGKSVTIKNVGTTVITAKQAGNATYNPAANVTQNLVINPKSLTVSSAVANSKVYDGTTDATISGTLTGIVGTDTVVLNGTGNFANPNVGTAKPVTSTSTITGADAGSYVLVQPTGLTADITKASQTISFGTLPTKTTGDADFKLNGSASSGLALHYVSSNAAVATIKGDTAIHIVGAGTADITASQAGNNNYNAATSVQQTLTVISAIAKWNFDSITTSNTGGTVIISVGSGVADAGEHTTGSLFTATHASTATTWSNPAGNGSLKSVSSNNWKPGDYYQFKVDKTNYKDVIVKWDQNSSSTGPGSFRFQYSLNGTSFKDFSTYSIPSGISWSQSSSTQSTAFTADLSALVAVDTAKIIYFRLRDSSNSSVTGDTVATGGSSRVDNFTVIASSSTSSCPSPKSLKATVVSSTVVRLRSAANASAVKYKIQYRPAGTSVWTSKIIDTNVIKIKALTPATEYEWQMACICQSSPLIISAYTTGPNFTTAAFEAIASQTSDKQNSGTLNAYIFPNPAANSAQLHLNNYANSVAITLRDITGKTIWQSPNVKNNLVTIPLQNIAKGMYIVTVTNGKENKEIKLVKQ